MDTTEIKLHHTYLTLLGTPLSELPTTSVLSKTRKFMHQLFSNRMELILSLLFLLKIVYGHYGITLHWICWITIFLLWRVH